MLLPSALPCDRNQITIATSARPILRRFMPYSNSQTGLAVLPTMSTISGIAPSPPVTHLANASGFPFPSPILSPSSITSGIQSTCRALQSFLGVAPSTVPITSKSSKIPLQPTNRASTLGALPVQTNRISKRRSSLNQPPKPSRGRNKRTRDDYETADLENAMEVDLQGSLGFVPGRNHGYSYDSAYPDSSPSEGDAESAGLATETKMFSTPKRRRRLPGPAELPFGLDRQDFADLEDDANATFSTPGSIKTALVLRDSATNEVLETPPPARYGSAACTDSDDEDVVDWWTPLDDAQLVTLVLEKMKLSRRDWEDCAKVLGAEGEGGSLGKRWKWLIDEGRVGLKANLHGGGRFEGRRATKRQGRADVRSIF